MKKLLLTALLFLSVLQAKSCVTDIYFGNGIWSKDKQQQLLSKNALKKIVNLDKSKEGETYAYKLAYNPGHGTTNDLIETYWQLKESGQISEGYFMATYIALSGQYTANAFVDKLLKIVTNYNAEVTTMYNTISNSSFKQKHNVLFVGHSQGNLFGNKMYTLLSDVQKKKFRMVSIGTVANKVAGDGKYVNIADDYVVNSIPNSLKGNFDGRGHDFQGVYLNIDAMRHFYDKGSLSAGTQIAKNVNDTYIELKQKSSCNTYRNVTVRLYALDRVDVVGLVYPTYGVTEVIASLPVTTHDAHIDNNGYYTCGTGDNINWYGTSDLGFENGEYFDWYAGYIQNKTSLESRAGIANILQLDSKCITSLSLTGELYDVIESAFSTTNIQ